jgi:hypothetical protein
MTNTLHTYLEVASEVGHGDVALAVGVQQLEAFVVHVDLILRQVDGDVDRGALQRQAHLLVQEPLGSLYLLLHNKIQQFIEGKSVICHYVSMDLNIILRLTFLTSQA